MSLNLQDEGDGGAGSNGSAIIEVADLVKWHGPIEVLRGVSLSVSRGEVATIIGPSGSGKSTFLRCLNGLEAFQRGTVTIDGLRVDAGDGAADRTAVHRRVCRRVGMVFQSFNLFPHRTVVANVIEAPVHVLGLPPAVAMVRARMLLDRVGLLDRQEALPRELSGGQQQRVAIARALAMEPKVMLFDEPTSALDPRMTAEVLAVMSDLAADGLTMVIVTHAMHFARRVSHVVHVFGEGRVIESGPPEQIFDAPAQEATRTLLSEVLAA
jgi:polar amino acid transport system ATP-binding protein